MRRCSVLLVFFCVAGCVAKSSDAGGDPPSFADADSGDVPIPVQPGGSAADADGDSVDNEVDNCATIANADQNDSDGDGAGDVCDCDPNDSTLGARVLYDSLEQDRAMLAPAPGFSLENWNFGSAALRQNRLADNAIDAAFFGDALLSGEFSVFVTGVSTAIEDFGTDDLRQVAIVLGADTQSFAGLGCGIEVVEGLPVTQQTSILSFTADKFDPRIRADREAVQVGEAFELEMTVAEGSLRCRSSIGGKSVSVTAAMGESEVAAFARLGFYTRETRGAFTDLTVCAR